MERVVGFHKEGYNCAESILKACNEDTGLNIPISIASPFGSGMNVGSTCGAITGALMAIGALKGRKSSKEKNNSRESAKELMNTIKEKYGTLDCKDLKQKGVNCDDIIEYVYGILKESTYVSD